MINSQTTQNDSDVVKQDSTGDSVAEKICPECEELVDECICDGLDNEEEDWDDDDDWDDDWDEDEDWEDDEDWDEGDDEDEDWDEN